MSGQNTLKNFCNECDKSTNHTVLAQHDWHSDPNDYSYAQYHKLVKCLGCDSVSLRIEDHEIESAYQISDDEWVVPQTITTFPKKLQNHKKIDNDYLIPQLVRNIYNEVLLTLQEDAKILSSLGLRACIESVCNHLEITGGNLAIRINKLTTAGYISKKDAERLHAIRFMGNDSAHEIKAPKEDSLKIALEIVEHLLKSVFILPEQANGYLDTIIDQYQLFETLLEKHLSNFKTGDEYPLYHFFEKDWRRVQDCISSFQTELIENINNSNFALLEVGKKDINKKGDEIQHFIIKKHEVTE
ncbi:DUF4145 domain-containing protein [Acinetobacter sichuanensis]|uniref:DUF4145 domain-containing protein n=1 Tax=Acinetobacter sichuanensis TaxID=2136183 RepID=UPI00280FF8DE|nr:DUF4145 domain-containing protein [Acinetobacter sichuanensis]MDQ9020708.1 DUF4145 domain-containing protein [Acinetobacter sichuanensis]